ncbi:glycoside hydrolase family 13 protein [soil metagenome]
MKLNRLLVLIIVFISCLQIETAAQNPALYPTHWWTGMKWNKVQVLVNRPMVGKETIRMKPYAGVQLKKIAKAESWNYVFIDLEITAAAKPGNIQFVISNLQGPEASSTLSFNFELKQRRAGRGNSFAQGVNSSDFVYLVMPDRFSNGDKSNDRIDGYLDTISDRSNPSAHHGGDMQGVINRLDYLKDLGITTIWMTPVTENDMPWEEEPAGAISGYHGYWITNHYKIDKRYGGDEAYKKLSDETHKKGMKIIQDAVYNHVGNQNFLFKDMPFKDMFNHWPKYTGSNHREEILYDKYSNEQDEKVMLDGWFTPHLPDVNLRNPYMATFLIQNDIWCTEEFGVDGWRVDTYKYCYEPFLNQINDALLREYPGITVFGEAWCNTVTGSAYFTRNNINVPFKHNLLGVCDFPMQGAMVAAANQPFGWSDGVNKLYSTLAQDILYQQPKNNCIFLDNHDMDRFVTMIGGDMSKYKMGFSLLLTQRGIPQMYYGTEIFMKNDDVQGDGKKRNDFPGGFAGDAADKFDAPARTSGENEAFEYVKALANFRKKSSAIANGNTMQYVPKDGVYVYFRYDKKQTIMVVLNTNDKASVIDANRFADRTKGFTVGKEVVSGKSVALSGNINIPAKTSYVLNLQ